MAKEKPKSKKPFCTWKRLQGCGCIVLFLAIILGIGQAHALYIATGPGGSRTLAYLVALQAIREYDLTAAPAAWFGAPIRKLREIPEVPWAILAASWKAIFGINWVHPRVYRSPLPALMLPSDTESRFCYSLLSYLWSHPDDLGYQYPSVYVGLNESQSWIKSCKAVWPELSDEEKQLLEPFRSKGDIPFEANLPERDNSTQRRSAARSKPFPAFEDSKRLTREEITDLLKDSIAQSYYAGAAEPSETLIEHFSLMNMRKVNEIPATWSDIGKAIREGRIAKFDATKLMPTELWNITVGKLAQWEGLSAKRIPLYLDGSLPTTFAEFAHKMQIKCQKPKGVVAMADESMSTVEGRPSNLKELAGKNGRLDFPSAGYIHSRRLPAFHKRLPNIEGPMGIEEDTLRGQSMLWIGSTPGGFHYDEEANVYLQLSGVSFVHLVPQNWTDYLTGAERHPWKSAGIPGWNAVEKDPELRNVPIYMFALYPGDGVTLHGRTYHRFMAQTHDRIALNWFFIPGWRKMEYTPADWYSIEASRSLTRLALRQLWARTIAKLYDDTSMGVVYMGTKLEYL